MRIRNPTCWSTRRLCRAARAELQPPRGVVAGFSSEAELSQQQVELQEQQQQQLLLRQQQGQLQQFWRLLVQTCLQRGLKAVPTGQ